MWTEMSGGHESHAQIAKPPPSIAFGCGAVIIAAVSCASFQFLDDSKYFIVMISCLLVLGALIFVFPTRKLFTSSLTTRVIDNASDPFVAGVHRSESHNFSKKNGKSITLIKGLGVEGDCHAGVTVQHLSRIARDPTVPNLRQVHLIHSELFNEVKESGFTVQPGDLGENITTCGVEILSLPTGTRLHIGTDAVVEFTGLRNPCAQIERFQPGLLSAVLKTSDDGKLIRKAGVMSVVVESGVVKPGDNIKVELPHGTYKPLEPV